MNFAKLTEEAIQICGSIAALAQRIGVTQQAVYLWLAGKTIPRADNAFAMADLVRARKGMGRGKA